MFWITLGLVPMIKGSQPKPARQMHGCYNNLYSLQLNINVISNQPTTTQQSHKPITVSFKTLRWRVRLQENENENLVTVWVRTVIENKFSQDKQL